MKNSPRSWKGSVETRKMHTANNMNNVMGDITHMKLQTLTGFLIASGNLQGRMQYRMKNKIMCRFDRHENQTNLIGA